jgi:heme/copper-type cytochrome/quinol oxidase subunit 2
MQTGLKTRLHSAESTSSVEPEGFALRHTIMTMTRRSLALLFFGVGGALAAALGTGRVLAQEAPNRREFTIVAKDFQYAPNRIEVAQDDLVKLTVRSEDIAHSFTLDEYRISKRVPAGGSTTFEFQADRAGTFAFYCALTGDPSHKMMHGQLVVRGK